FSLVTWNAAPGREKFKGRRFGRRFMVGTARSSSASTRRQVVQAGRAVRRAGRRPPEIPTRLCRNSFMRFSLPPPRGDGGPFRGRQRRGEFRSLPDFGSLPGTAERVG